MLRIGVVGLGEVAQVTHLSVLSAMPEMFDVVSICDISPRLVESVGDRFGIRGRYSSSENLIAAGGIDAVLVLNSDEYHAETVLQALKSDLHVLVEKPMCLSMREAETIIDAQERSGLVVMVGYMRRYASAFLEAKDVANGMGEIRFARAHGVIGRNQLIVDQTSLVVRPDDIPVSLLDDKRRRAERLVKDAIGDVPPAVVNAYRLLCGLGSHDLSAMRELLGAPMEVISAHQWRNGRYISAIMESRGTGIVYETGVDELVRFDAHLELYAEKSALRVQYDTPYIRHLPVTLEVERSVGNSYEKTVGRPELKDPYTREWEHFYECVKSSESPKTDPEDFAADLELFKQLTTHLAGAAERAPRTPRA